MSVELETFLGEWKDSFGNDVSVDWAKAGSRGGQLSVVLTNPKSSRPPIRLDVKSTGSGFTCGHYDLDTEKSSEECIVWLDTRRSGKSSVWRRDGVKRSCSRRSELYGAYNGSADNQTEYFRELLMRKSFIPKSLGILLMGDRSLEVKKELRQLEGRDGQDFYEGTWDRLGLPDELGFNLDFEPKEDGCPLKLKENVTEVRAALARFFDVMEVWIALDWLEGKACGEESHCQERSCKGLEARDCSAELEDKMGCANEDDYGFCKLRSSGHCGGKPPAGDGPVSKSFMIEFHQR
eukprot:s209_g25.t1